MAFKRINAISFMADSVEDLKDLPASKMGSECFVIENGKEYKCNSRGEWVDPWIITATDGTRFRIVVSSDGILSTEPVS